MILFPAMDLKDGQVVRLYKGDFATVQQVAQDPAATATAFRDAGAAYVHMVDLDGAQNGQRKNRDIVQTVVQSGLKVQLGGGIRTQEDLAAVFDMGVYRAVLGSAAVSNPQLVADAVARWGAEHIAVGVDARNGKVCTAGWVEDSGLDYCEFAREMEALGVSTLIFTDIDTDGTLQGPSFQRLEQLHKAVDCRIIASGGVSSNEDLRRLSGMGLYGAIIGKAWYTGAVDLARAVREEGAQ